MADDDDTRPSLEAPRLFGRRRPTPTDEAPVFADAATEPVAPVRVPAAAPVPAPTAPDAETRADASRVPAAPTEPAEPAARRRTPRLDLAHRLRALKPVRSTTAHPDTVPSKPLLTGRSAAVVAGVVAGLALVAFTWVGFRGCEAIRGSTSCGTAPGFVAQILVLVLAVVVGSMLLSAFKVPDPGATSFLGVGLTGVICLLFLYNALDHWSVVIYIPLITALTFLLSWWVTTTYVDTD